MTFSVRPAIEERLTELGFTADVLLIVSDSGLTPNMLIINRLLRGLSADGKKKGLSFPLKDRKEIAKSVRKAAVRHINAKDATNKEEVKKKVFESTVGVMTPHAIEQMPDDVKIEWESSSANNPNSYHAAQYGKIMTMREAKGRGWGGGRDKYGTVHYGCQCGAKILKSSDTKKINNAIRL